MTKNLIFLVHLLLPILPLASSQHNEFIFTGFAANTTAGVGGSKNVSLNGVAEIESNGVLRLTNETSRLIGRAFYPYPLLFKNSSAGGGGVGVASFSTAFVFAIVPEYPKLGGHGFAFVLATTQQLAGALPSQYLGLLNSSDNGNSTNHVFAIEFDTVQDFEFNDINDNHVGVDVNSLVSSKSAAASYVDSGGQQIPLNLKSGDPIQTWIDYDGEAKLLNLTLSPFSSKPTTPLYSFPIDLAPILHNEMYVGFSASTGLLASSHYLFGWSFKMNGAAESLDLSSLPSLPRPSNKKSPTFVAVSVSLSVIIVLLIAAAVASYAFYRYKNREIIEPWELEYGPHRFTYKSLRRATKGFRDRELLGVGGFGKVYKGVLSSSGADIAVKRISHDSKQGIREFVAEIASIGRLRHRNLVQLQGWCRYKSNLLLVYDYMPNGSLDQFLFHPSAAAPKPVLTWDDRFRILRGVASGLLYLHEEWESVVIHRDIKASNVLLDADFNGRLGDFGLAKLHEHGANPSTTRVVGTLGYLAPELTRTGKATASSDVFAFGALVLEVVCGRRPIEPKASPEELILVDWVWEKWSEKRWPDVVDPLLRGVYDMEEVEVAIKVGLLCSQPVPVARPTMREVARYLDGGDTTEVPNVPPPPPAGLYEYESSSAVKDGMGFEDFVHSYPSSSFEKVSASSPVTGTGDGESPVVAGYMRVPLISI
ncbi:L-type lectin-domain containing receptor kinase S.4-like [Phalaenopsis equestris]|uniref:L-type lectin-domain containing receptor kinase S.4-like n=1 Tax=Phalaenopsis equestris TaxID=78828 RepID=UPI0009E3B4B4|nr:L-type lectin-domain containing receptor kinase S.4-like [Phalaenopsis equestris]